MGGTCICMLRHVGCHQLQVGVRHGKPEQVPFPVILCLAYEPGSVCDSKAVAPSHCCTCNVLTVF